MITIIFFPEFRKIYNNSMSKTYDEKYAEIIEQYQEGLDKDSSNKLVQKIIEQPSRQPSYAKIDSDGDNKKELYIAFKDGEEKYKILAVYEAGFNSVKEIDVSDTDVSDEQLGNANWDYFDVSHLLTMNLDELEKDDYSSIAGTWVMPRVQGLATKVRITEDGTMYWDNSTTAGKKLHDIVKNSDGSGLGISGEEYTRQSAPTGSYVNFFPAGVVVKGGENSDSSKDRIAFGGSTMYYNDPYVFYRLDE